MKRYHRRVCDVAAGLTRLRDWGVESFADERREPDAAVDDGDGDRWGDTP